MTNFWAVMLDETGCEFGVGVRALNRGDAYEQLREDYPESRCVQLESPQDTREREAMMYARLEWEMDNPGMDWEDY